MQVFTTLTAKETEALATELLPQLLKSRLVLLSGHLGSGKTTFVKGLAKALGIKERIKSPTYVYVQKYVISNLQATSYKLQALIHIDLYRLPSGSKPDILAELGLEGIIGAPHTLTAIEWPERADARQAVRSGPALPAGRRGAGGVAQHSEAEILSSRFQPRRAQSLLVPLKGAKIRFTKRENFHEIAVEF